MEFAFYICGLIAILATLRVITHTNPVHALLYLIISLLAISGVFFSLGAYFAGALEIIVYAGAIMVLFVFVVMMLNLGIGLCTPPVGTALFTGCAIAGRKIESVSKATLPLYVPMLVVLLLVTYIPGLTMALPNLLMK